MLLLVEPTLAQKAACLDAVREFHAAGEYPEVTAEQLAARFEELITRLVAANDLQTRRQANCHTRISG